MAALVVGSGAREHAILAALARAKCLKTGAYFWHGVWNRLRAKHPDLDRKCPTFARAYEQFVAIAPKEAEMPCFWTFLCDKS